MQANKNNISKQVKDNLLQRIPSKYIRQKIFDYLLPENQKKLFKSHNKQLSNDLLETDKFKSVLVANVSYIIYLDELLINFNQDMCVSLFNDIFDDDTTKLEAKLASLNDEALNDKFVFVDKIQNKSLRLWIKMLSIERIMFDILSLKEEDFQSSDLLEYFPVKSKDDIYKIIKHIVASKSEVRINKIIDKINTDNPYDDFGYKYKYEIQTFDSYATESGKNFDECENREIIWLNFCATLVGQTSNELNKNYRLDPDAGYFATEDGICKEGATRDAYQSEIEQSNLKAYDFYEDNLTLRKVILDLFSFEKECQEVNSDAVQSNKERSKKLEALRRVRRWKNEDYDKHLNNRLTFCRSYDYRKEKLDDEYLLQREYKAMLAVVLANNPEKIMGIASQKLLESAKIALDTFHKGEKEYLDIQAKWHQAPDLLGYKKATFEHCKKYYEKYFQHQKPWDEVKIKLDEAARSLSPLLSFFFGLFCQKKENIYREWRNTIKQRKENYEKHFEHQKSLNKTEDDQNNNNISDIKQNVTNQELINEAEIKMEEQKNDNQQEHEESNIEKVYVAEKEENQEKIIENQEKKDDCDEANKSLLFPNKEHLHQKQQNTIEQKQGIYSNINKKSSWFKWLGIAYFVISACEIATMLILTFTGVIELNWIIFLISFCIASPTFSLGCVNLWRHCAKSKTTSSEIKVTTVDINPNVADKNINQLIKQNTVNQEKVPKITSENPKSI